MSRREDNKTSRRKQIIDAARRLMRARNASGFSMRTLAEVAGVSIARPTICSAPRKRSSPP